MTRGTFTVDEDSSDADSGPSFEPLVASGDVIAGRYEVQDLIGHGGVGFVVSARDLSSGDEVAIKLLRPECTGSGEAVRRFRIEATALAAISSDRIVSVLAVDALPDGTPFMVMERLQGSDLGSVLAAQGPLSIERAVGYVLHACEGLAAAHAAGLRHFDLKPANLFLVEEDGIREHVKLIDFGVSEGRAHALENHASGDTLIGIGSPAYMSPERRRGEPSDDRSDIWSLGCVLYELLAGEPLFVRDEPPRTRSSIIVDEDALGPCLTCPDIPPGLEAVIRRCIALQPKARFGDVAELAAALVPFAAEDNSGASEYCWQLLHGRDQAEFGGPSEQSEQEEALSSASDPLAGGQSQISARSHASSVMSARSPAKQRVSKLALLLWMVAGLLAYSAYARIFGSLG